MKIFKLSIALIFAILAFFAQAAFLRSHQESAPGKFIDDCIQWGIDRLKQNYQFTPATDIVPTYNLTSLVVNYTFGLYQQGPCPEGYAVNATLYCPFVGGDDQILYYHIKQDYP